ncbi:MAG: MSHA biogenesis protein MshO [Oceanospirillaceae bacterium]|jgi:MSHA biogenesis protein MshO
MPYPSHHYPSRRQKKQRGFSLVELILVIVIMAIITVGSTQFIVNSVKGLNDVTRRDSLANNLRISIAKIENQLQASLSNSVRVNREANTQCVEMLPIKASAFYLAGSLANNAFNTIALKSNVLGLKAVLGAPDAAILYSANNSVTNKVDSKGAVLGAITKQVPVNNSQFNQLSLLSTAPLKAFFVKPTKAPLAYFVGQAISYCIVAGDLYRYSGYSVSLKQPMPKTLPLREPNRVLLNRDLGAPSNFSFVPDQGLFTLVLSTANSAEQLTINQSFWLSNE